MEEKTIVTNSLNENLILDTKLLFEWKCLEKKVVGGKIILSFSRDNEKPYYDELLKLEKEYGDYRIPSLLPSFILAGLSFILITVFFILYLVDRSHYIVYFLSIVLPALACLLGAMVFTVLRYSSYNKLIKEKPEKDQVFAEKIKELKERYSK